MIKFYNNIKVFFLYKLFILYSILNVFNKMQKSLNLLFFHIRNYLCILVINFLIYRIKNILLLL